MFLGISMVFEFYTDCESVDTYNEEDGNLVNTSQGISVMVIRIITLIVFETFWIQFADICWGRWVDLI